MGCVSHHPLSAATAIVAPLLEAPWTGARNSRRHSFAASVMVARHRRPEPSVAVTRCAPPETRAVNEPAVSAHVGAPYEKKDVRSPRVVRPSSITT